MTIKSKFAETCTNCRCPFPAGTDVSWARGMGARHLTPAACAAALAAKAAAPVVVEAPVFAPCAAIAKFLSDAHDRGLKFPKARFAGPNGDELKLTRAGARSKFPGSLSVELAGVWIGRVMTDGAVHGRLRSMTEVTDLLVKIAADPAFYAKEYGMLTGRCAFCNLTLTDEGSTEVGYGPICARKFGLPHSPKGTPDITRMPGAVATI